MTVNNLNNNPYSLAPENAVVDVTKVRKTAKPPYAFGLSRILSISSTWRDKMFPFWFSLFPLHFGIKLHNNSGKMNRNSDWKSNGGAKYEERNGGK